MMRWMYVCAIIGFLCAVVGAVAFPASNDTIGSLVGGAWVIGGAIIGGIIDIRQV